MASSEHKRQQKLAKRNKRASEVRKSVRKNRNRSARDMILACAESPWCECIVNGIDGINQVVAIRKGPGGVLMAASFLVDQHCLGVKDAFFTEDYDIDQALEMMRRSEGNLRRVTPAYALKLIEGGIAYARSIGFEPHPQAELCKLIFRNVDPTECQEEFEFGKDGKPRYWQGPRESPSRVNLILKQLQKLGEGNYHFILVDADLRSLIGLHKMHSTREMLSDPHSENIDWIESEEDEFEDAMDEDDFEESGQGEFNTVTTSDVKRLDASS